MNVFKQDWTDYVFNQQLVASPVWLYTKIRMKYKISQNVIGGSIAKAGNWIRFFSFCQLASNDLNDVSGTIT